MSWAVVDCSTHFGTLPYRDTDVSLEKLLSRMDAYGVAAALTYSLRGVLYDFEEGNDETLAATQTNPRLLPVATVDPRRHIGVIEEIEKRREQGFVALRVFPDVQMWQIGSVMFRPILRELDRLRMPLIVPCPTSGSATEILRAVEGSSIPVVMCGVGYFTLAEAIAACRQHPHLYVEVGTIDPPDSLAVAVDAIGPERFVFGSGSPSNSMKASLNLVAESPLADDDKTAVFSGNACRILGIDIPQGIGLSMDAPFEGIPVIDIHSHFGKWPFPMRGTGVEFTLELMKRRGIRKTIMSSSEAIVYDLVEGNARMAQAIEGRPELFGYVTVNPNHYDLSCRELEKYCRTESFVGAKIHPMYSKREINSPEMKALLRKIAEYGRTLLVHTWGGAATAHVHELACEFPYLPVIMGHAGGAEAWKEAAEVVRQTKNVYLEFCGTIHEADRIRRTIEITGSDKVLFGSDLDLIHPGFIAGAYEEAGLSREENEKILYKNACRLFGFHL